MKSAISTLAALIFIATLFGALLLWSTNVSVGFVPEINLGFWRAVAVLFLGSAIALSLNLLRWRLYGALLWLRGVVAVQALLTVACLGLLGYGSYGSWRESQGETQFVRIIEAIAADDPQRLTRAQAACGSLCSARFSLNELLLRSAEDGSGRVAAQLIRQSARVSAESGEQKRDARTCDAAFLPGLDALSMAAARNDLDMVRLLWPVSDAGSRRRALWTAAQTDRLVLVQWLSQAGVPLSIRGDILDQNNTLMVAAASGAAVHVGQWLIESQHMPVNALVGGPDPYTGTAPVAALHQFVTEVGVTPEATAMLHLLAAHGADIDVHNGRGDWPLEEAVRIHQRAVVKLFLDAGANASLLDTRQHAAMDELLAQPDDAPSVSSLPEGCIDTHGSEPLHTGFAP